MKFVLLQQPPVVAHDEEAVHKCPHHNMHQVQHYSKDDLLAQWRRRRRGIFRREKNAGKSRRGEVLEKLLVAIEEKVRQGHAPENCRK